MAQSQATQAAMQGGIQEWSVGAPYPYVVVAIDNPSGFPKGLYWYVVDTRKGSTDHKDRIGLTGKGPLASLYATCHARALYAHHVALKPIHEAQEEYDEYWKASAEYAKATLK